MKRIKTQDLTGAALNWAVAKCQPDDTLSVYFDEDTGEPLCHDDWPDNQEFKPSTDWAQGGPIIERERIAVIPCADSRGRYWAAGKSGPNATWIGKLPLIAAMRCYVASKLGDEIEIPKEIAPCNT